MNAVPVNSPARVRPHPGHALAGIWRLTAQRFFTPQYWLILAALLAVLVVFSIPAARTESMAHERLLPWAAGFYACFLVPILSFIAAAGAMRDDLSGATVDYVLTRPVPRPLYIVFRYLAQMVAAQISFLFALGVIGGIGLFWGVPDLAPALVRLGWTQFCGVAAFSSVGFLCGLLTSRYVIVGILYTVVVDHGLGAAPAQFLNQISLFRHQLALAGPLLGDGGWALTRAGVAGLPSAPLSALVLALVTIAVVAITAVLFSLREFAGTAARDA